MQQAVGKTAHVIMEKEDFGRTEHFTTVQFAESLTIGSLVTAHITGVEGKHLVGQSV